MFMRAKVTVPPAGQSVRVEVSGMALVVERVQLFDDPEQVPLVSFDTNRGVLQPLYPQSVYNPYGHKPEFQAFFVHGTEGSEGQEIYTLVSDCHLDQDGINTLFVSPSGLARMVDEAGERFISISAGSGSGSGSGDPAPESGDVVLIDAAHTSECSPDKAHGYSLLHQCREVALNCPDIDDKYMWRKFRVHDYDAVGPFDRMYVSWDVTRAGYVQKVVSSSWNSGALTNDNRPESPSSGTLRDYEANTEYEITSSQVASINTRVSNNNGVFSLGFGAGFRSGGTWADGQSVSINVKVRGEWD